MLMRATSYKRIESDFALRGKKQPQSSQRIYGGDKGTFFKNFPIEIRPQRGADHHVAEYKMTCRRERVYLIPTDKIIDFCKTVNSGWQSA